MARYTDIDKLIAEYDRVHIGPAGGARKLMVEAPIADVVPREEIEKIFQDIGILFNKYPTLGTIGGKELVELKKKYTEGE